MHLQKKRMAFAAVLCLALPTLIAANTNQVPVHLISFAEEELAQFGRSPQVVMGIRQHNQLNLSLQEIKDRDAVWRDTDRVSRFMLDLMSNDLALVLHNFSYRNPFIVESFAMGRLGENAGQTALTSDYWQGDEAKFTASFANGAGAIHYGDIEYDASADEIVIQVSVPVIDGTTAIGAITFSISLDRWEKR